MRVHLNLPKLCPWPTPQTLKQSTQLHAQMVVTGALLSKPASTHLLKSLCNPSSGDISHALNLFDQIPQPPTFLWNITIQACARNHAPEQSIRLYRDMHRKGTAADTFTFRFLFKSCAISASIIQGHAAHGAFFRRFPESCADAVNSLINMYLEFGCFDAAMRAFGQIRDKDVVSWTTVIGGLVKAGSINDARVLFDEMPEKNVVSWTSMIAGYTRAGRAAEAVDYFKRMLSDNVAPDAVAMGAVLTACAQLPDLEIGKWLHELIVREGISVDDKLAVSLVDMYAKCGDMASARQVFEYMAHKILPAWNAIIDGYCKAGDVDIARTLFNQMGTRDLISFNSMISGYIQSSRLKEALLLFAKLRASGMQPDNFSVVGLLTACASLGALSQGKAIHGHLVESGIEPDIFIETALLDMYGKCGRMQQALLVFNRMYRKDVMSWTAVISGLAMNGMGDLSLEYFALMQKEGIRPNSVAYIGVLNACSHSGLVEEGQINFREMRTLYNLEPEIEHYGCMVDLLGRGGRLTEAMELIQSMPMEPNAVIWGSVLSSCRVYKNVDLAEAVAKHLIVLEPHEDAAYVQLYNIYMATGRFSDASRIRGQMEGMGIKKIAGYSSITVGGQVHKFVSGDMLHPELMEIQENLSEMAKRLRLAGYFPITSQVSFDVDEEDKEQVLLAHSEKIAIAYGIMRLGANMTIHVVKNLRVCEDCHSAIKLISKIWKRHIVVRDRSRFHHFRDGKCSCKDFW